MSIHEDILERVRWAVKQTEEPPELWIIKIDGKRIITNSGKNVWAKKHHASSSLKMEMNTIVGHLFRNEKHTWRADWQKNKDWFENEYPKWKEEHVEFVRIF